MKKRTNIMICVILMIALVLFDQLTKIHIVNHCTEYEIYKNYFGDVINITLVYNKGAAFSLGNDLDGILRVFVLQLLPIVGLLFLLFFALFSKDINNTQRIFIFGILAGGIGNLLDRFFRADGVVDFIDVKFFGIFGMDRWPTFNIADTTVVIFGICLFISIIIKEFQSKEKTKITE